MFGINKMGRVRFLGKDEFGKNSIIIPYIVAVIGAVLGVTANFMLGSGEKGHSRVRKKRPLRVG